MTPRRILGTLALLLAIVLAIYYGAVNWDAAQWSTEWKAQEATLTELNSRLKELSSEIQDAHGKSVCDGSSQCKVIGMGTPICGDYKDYLIYSTKDADEARLLSIVATFNEVHQKVSNLSLAVGNCGIKPARVECVNGHCVLQAKREGQ